MPTENEQQPGSPSPSDDDKKEPEIQDGEEEFSDVELATQLYQNLNDPSKAKDIVKFLASKAGLKVVEEEVTPKKAVKEVMADLKDGVPEQLHFLIDGLKPAIEKIVNSRIEASLEPIRENSMSLRERQVMNEINSAYSVMREKYKDWDKIEPKLTTLSDEMPHKPGSDMVKYLDRLYRLYTADVREGKVVKDAVDKINTRARNDTNVRSAETSESTTSRGSKLPTLRESVVAAVRGEKFQ